jgi:hypothetical protein
MYDLNIFRKEVEVLDSTEGTIWEYQDPWFVDVYVFEDGCQEPILDSQSMPLSIELTEEESRLLQLGIGYFKEDDTFIDLDEFLNNYEHQISDRLFDIFNALPIK